MRTTAAAGVITTISTRAGQAAAAVTEMVAAAAAAVSTPKFPRQMWDRTALDDGLTPEEERTPEEELTLEEERRTGGGYRRTLRGQVTAAAVVVKGCHRTLLLGQITAGAERRRGYDRVETPRRRRRGGARGGTVDRIHGIDTSLRFYYGRQEALVERFNLDRVWTWV